MITVIDGISPGYVLEVPTKAEASGGPAMCTWHHDQHPLALYVWNRLTVLSVILECDHSHQLCHLCYSQPFYVVFYTYV